MDPKKLKKITNYVKDPNMSFFDELNELNDKIGTIDQTLKETFGKVNLEQLNHLKGESGGIGATGRDGKDGRHGMSIKGETGPIGPMGPRGPMGSSGKNGKDAEAVTPEGLRDRLHGLKGEARLRAEAVVGIPTAKDIIDEIKKNKSLTASDLKDGQSLIYPNKKQQDLRWHGSGVWQLTAGANVTITDTDPTNPNNGAKTISANTTSQDTVSNEVPAGAINGVNHVFTTAHNFVTGTTRLYLNGLRQRLGGGFDYTEIAVNQVSFVIAPVVGDFIIIDYDRV